MRTRYTWLLICLMIFGASCKKGYLDRNPLDLPSSAVFWTSDGDVQTALAGVYSRLQTSNSGQGNFLGYERVYLDGLSDNAYLDPGNTNLPNMTLMTTGSITAASGGPLVSMYAPPYRAIVSCNYFLDNVDKAPIADVAKNKYKAEVRFIRALAYFDLAQAFGSVIIYRNFFPTLEAAKIAKSPVADVYAFIHEDLDFAIANLSDDRYNGHAVKGSALGLKARVLITQQRWADAVPVLQQIIDGKKFALSNDYAGLFKTAGQANAAVNAEIMFSTQYLGPTDAQRTSPGAAGTDIELGWFSLMQPYQDLVNEYEMTDGKMPSESPLYKPATPYAGRDPRLDLTVKLPGEVWKNTAGTVWNGSYVSRTGFLVEKYVDLSRAPFTTNTATATDQDFIHLRYADVLLMYAEAKNEATGPDAAGYAAVNQVRARTGINMPAVDQSRYTAKDTWRTYIRHERRVEFAFEGQRYNDLKRWNIAHIKLPTLKTPDSTPLVFTTTNYLLPFPQSELDNNPNLRQTTGY